MRALRPARALLLVAALAAAAPSRGAAWFDEGWYVPDQSKLQLAGWVGFLSPGVGYSWFDRRVEADLFFGWVPPPLGGEHITSLTSKLTWLPLRLAVGDQVTVQPLSLSLQVTYTFGHEYWVFEPSKYPTENYYPLPTALRGGVGIGGDVGLPLWGLERAALYYELVAIDVMLGYWIGNRHAVSPVDVFSLALGLRLEH
jgi:hypothetical protein